MGYGGVTRGRCSSEEACFGLAAPGKESGGGVLLGLWWVSRGVTNLAARG